MSATAFHRRDAEVTQRQRREIRKRVFWLLFFSAKSLRVLGVSAVHLRFEVALI
jgi:hypothetical protein